MGYGVHLVRRLGVARACIARRACDSGLRVNMALRTNVALHTRRNLILVRKQYLQLRRHTHRDHVAPRTPKRQRYSCTQHAA